MFQGISEFHCDASHLNSSLRLAVRVRFLNATTPFKKSSLGRLIRFEGNQLVGIWTCSPHAPSFRERCGWVTCQSNILTFLSETIGPRIENASSESNCPIGPEAIRNVPNFAWWTQCWREHQDNNGFYCALFICIRLLLGELRILSSAISSKNLLWKLNSLWKLRPYSSEIYGCCADKALTLSCAPPMPGSQEMSVMEPALILAFSRNHFQCRGFESS